MKHGKSLPVKQSIKEAPKLELKALPVAMNGLFIIMGTSKWTSQSKITKNMSEI